MKSQNLEGYITRSFKTVTDSKPTYEIRHAAVKAKVVSEHEFEDATFKLTTGDYQRLMELVVQNLEKAKVI